MKQTITKCGSQEDIEENQKKRGMWTQEGAVRAGALSISPVTGISIKPPAQSVKPTPPPDVLELSTQI